MSNTNILRFNHQQRRAKMKLDANHIYRYNNGMLGRGNNVMRKQPEQAAVDESAAKEKISMLWAWVKFDGTAREFAESYGVSHSTLYYQKNKYLNGDYGDVDEELAEKLYEI